jgi:hypothetical protein
MAKSLIKAAIQLRWEIQSEFGVDAEDLQGKGRDPDILAAKAAYIARGRALGIPVVIMADVLGVTPVTISARSSPKMQETSRLRAARRKALAKGAAID